MVLYVEEGVIVGQFDHLEGMICGFMDNGQVEKPVRRKGRRSLVRIVLIKKNTGRGNGSSQVRKNKA